MLEGEPEVEVEMVREKVGVKKKRQSRRSCRRRTRRQQQKKSELEVLRR